MSYLLGRRSRNKSDRHCDRVRARGSIFAVRIQSRRKRFPNESETLYRNRKSFVRNEKPCTRTQTVNRPGATRKTHKKSDRFRNILFRVNRRDCVFVGNAVSNGNVCISRETRNGIVEGPNNDSLVVISTIRFRARSVYV